MGKRGGHAAGLEVLCRSGLRKGAGVGIAELLAHGGLGQQLGLRNHPAHAQARAEHLAQGPAVHQQLAAPGHARAQRQQRGWRCGVEVQVAIGIVFHDHRLVFDRQLQHALAALQAQQATAGVTKGGNQVDELGLVFGNQGFEPVGLHAIAIDGGADQFRAVQAEALDGGQEGGAFHNDLVAGADQGLAQQVQRLLAAGRDDEVVGSHVLAALAGHEACKLFAQRSMAFGGAVLQCGASLFGQCGIDGFANALHIEHGRIGEAARKTDDPRFAQQLEEFTDGRSFNVVQSVSKLHEITAFYKGMG